MSRLKDQYNNEIRDALVKKFGYTNPMQIPKLDKIVVNMAVGEAKENEKLLETAAKDLETITGQKPVYTKAKKSIANFTWLFPACVTSAASIRTPSMEEEITLLVFTSRSSSRRSSTTRSIRSEAWTSSSRLRRRPMRKQESFSVSSTCRLRRTDSFELLRR